jgi:hypothetical protein
MNYRNELNEQISEKKENLLINENKENDKKERDIKNSLYLFFDLLK